MTADPLSYVLQADGMAYLVTIGSYAAAAAGPAMAVSIGFALQAPPLVLFSLAAVGGAEAVSRWPT